MSKRSKVSGVKEGWLTSLPLEGVDNIERCDGLALGVLGVGDCVADDTFEEGLEDTTGFFVDHCREDKLDDDLGAELFVDGRDEEHTGWDTLDTTTTSETTDGRLGNALDVVTKDLSVTLGTTLAETLSTFAASSHDDRCEWWRRRRSWIWMEEL
jgi:hypothetical protein